jgi:hypothetical protein
MVASHQMTLSGLAAGTTYYYQVNSTDSKGNNGHGGNKFKTAGFSLSGTLNPAAGGSGSTLTLGGAASSATTTADGVGNYTFAGLANGTYAVAPSHAGFVFTPSSQSMTVNGANVTGVNFTANAAPVAPTITTQPASQTVTAGQNASFSVTATGTAPLTFQWQKYGVAISGATSPSYTTPASITTQPVSQTSSSYTTPATTSSDNGALFTVVVSNTAGSVTSNPATLTVNAAPVAPSITTQPASQAVTAGQAASFSVAATGTAPLNYQWNKNGTAISGATASSYTTPATSSSDNGAQFTAVVSNTAGSVTSNTAPLTVNAAPVAPSITTQPASQTVTAGQAASFSVAATGTSPLSYQWQKNGAAISGATLSSYTTPATTSSDNGALFTVLVSNTAGSVTSSAATLTVNAAAVAPSITTQPASQTVTAGQTASFSVVATGTAPLAYQWQKNSAAISGATSSSYTTPAASSSDNGALFTVVVSNTAGSVTSSAATLTVNAATPPTVAITSPTNGATLLGTITVAGTASDAVGVSTIQVQVDGGAFSSASGTTNWTFGLDTASLSNAAHTITARATNTSGLTATTTVTVNVSNSGTVINVWNYGAAGNGSTDDTAAINNAIAALQPGYELFFPCGTYEISAGLTAITKNNLVIDGETGCGAGRVTIRSTGGRSTIIQVGSNQGLSSQTPITATTADLDKTFQANFSAIGAGIGDYVYLEETVTTSDTTHSSCGGSGCRGEVLKITGLSGNTATVETAVHHAYDTSCCVPWVQKLLNPVSGVTLHDLVLDGSGAANYALAVLDVVNLTVTNLTAQNVAWSAIASINGYNNSYGNITITRAGTNNGGSIGGSAVSLQQQGNLNVNGVSISNMNLGAFGFIPFREANGTFSNISVDATGTGSGRPFKTNSSAHNTFNNISVNRSEAAYYQGITLEYFSHHNVWNNCKVTNNVGSPNNSGITLYGDLANGNHQGSNHYNTFNNCTVTGNSGYAVWVNDNNNYLEINGGTYSSVAGQYVLAFDDSAPCCTNNAYIHNATINGPGSIGIFIENGSKNACINNNTFGLGLITGISVTDASDVGTGNILSGLSSNLNLGTCGPSTAVSISPTAATVASGGTQQFTATVTGLTNTAVTWTATAGSVSSSGLFTAPTVSAITAVTVTATSQADTSKAASATVTITPANIFGYAVQGASVGGTMSNTAAASRYQMTAQNGTVTSMSVFVASPISASPNNQFQVAIYADNSGTPGALIAQSASQTLVADSWNTIPISAPVTANAFYWFAYNTNGLAGNANNLRLDTTGGASTWINSQPFGTWPASYGPTGGTTSYNTSMYATFQ